MRMWRGARRLGVLAPVSGLMLTFAVTSPAFARTFTVTRDDDPSPQACQQRDCSLREAVAAADAHPGADTVDFARRLSQKTIRLTLGDVTLRRELAIEGPGARALAISASQSRIFHVVGGRVTIRGVTINHGRESASANGPTCPGTSATGYVLGGGVLEDAGNLKLVRVKVARNEVMGPQNTIIGGGGIANIQGNLSLVRSRVAANAVTGGSISGGGGILNCVGRVHVRMTRIHDSAVSSEAIGAGGGIANGLGAAQDAGRLSLRKATVESNGVSSKAVAQGGGLSTSGGPVTVGGTTIDDNSVTVTGGGTVSGGGGVLIANAKADFTNSTIANNLAIAPNSAGGGLEVGGAGPKLILRSTTVAGNIADGTTTEQGGNVAGAKYASARNTILAKGEATTGANCDGHVKSSRHDLEDEDTCGFDGRGDLVKTNPRLRDLARNGGPTRTMALRRRSPAIDHASSRTSPKRDQRGFVRGRKPDVGSYEFGATR